MPHALIVAEYGTLNGGERSLLSIVPHLVDAGWQLTALTPGDSDFANCLALLDVRVFPFSFDQPNGQRQPLDVLRDQLRQAIGELSPDLVHLNSLSTSRIAGPLARQLEIPFVGYLRDIVKLSKQAVADVNCIPTLVAVSHATRDWHIDQAMHPRQIEVVYNGVDLHQFQPRSRTGRLASELGIPSNSPILLAVGQIGMRKGLDVTLAAVRELLDDEPRIHLVLVGARYSEKPEAVDYETQLRRQAARADLSGHVHWLGDRRDVPALMNEASVLVHAARQEPLGRVLLESFASGLPAIATDVGGTREVFRERTLADWLIPPDDAAAMAGKIKMLLGDASLQGSLALQIRKVAELHFSSAKSADALLKLYRRALEKCE